MTKTNPTLQTMARQCRALAVEYQDTSYGTWVSLLDLALACEGETEGVTGEHLMPVTAQEAFELLAEILQTE